MDKKIKPFLDEQGRIKQLPSKKNVRDEIFGYLSGKFDANIKYTEKEVNNILTEWSTIGDYFILRRGLVDSEFLLRTADGTQYWKNPADDKKE
jgi:hypothetical protein